METPTLSQVMVAVPQLATTCGLAQTGGESLGFGIKLLRLVSKQMRIAMLSVVRGYTLTLSGTTLSLTDEMTVLQSSKLSRLHVKVKAASSGEPAW